MIVRSWETINPLHRIMVKSQLWYCIDPLPHKLKKNVCLWIYTMWCSPNMSICFRSIGMLAWHQQKAFKIVKSLVSVSCGSYWVLESRLKPIFKYSDNFEIIKILDSSSILLQNSELGFVVETKRFFYLIIKLLLKPSLAME